METLLIRHDIDLLPKPNEYRLVLDDIEPPRELVTSAFVLAFLDDWLLMSKLAERGWDIPGGHVEADETPQETAHRELHEETGVSVNDLQVLGYDQFVIQGTAPDGYRYPAPVSYQLFFWARVANLESFAETEEVLERRLFAPQEARQLRWVQANPELYAAALILARSSA